MNAYTRWSACGWEIPGLLFSAAVISDPDDHALLKNIVALEKAFPVNTQSLWDLLEGFQNHWRGPVSHRR